MGNQKKQAEKETRAYSLEEIEEKLKSVEGKIQFIQKRISRIEEFCERSTAEYNALLERKKQLEEELKHYTGFFAEFKHSLKAVFSGTDNQVKKFQKEIGNEIETVDKLIDEKLDEISQFEQAIANNEAKIDCFKKDLNKWQNKKKKREAKEESPLPKELA